MLEEYYIQWLIKRNKQIEVGFYSVINLYD
jgi:hypothetical protein